MNAKTLAFGGLAAGGAAAAVRRLTLTNGNGSSSSTTDRWHTVTVNRPADEVSGGRLPGPLAELGDRIEVQTRPAPGERGTEIAARLRGPVPSGLEAAAGQIRDEDPRGPLRKALRDTRSLLETGEVLSPDKPSTTHPGPGGKLIAAASSRAKEVGRL